MSKPFIIHNEHTRRLAIEMITKISIEKRWIMDLKREVKKRKLSQNGLMWWWLDDIAKESGDIIGCTKEEMHEIFKEKFLVPKVVEIEGDSYRIYSTKNLNRNEMYEYMEHIDRWAAQEMGIFLPMPSDLQRNE